jgi:hypothetical protein
MATRSTMVEPASVKRMKNSSFGGYIRWPTGDLPVGRRFTKGLSIHRGQEQGEYPPFPLLPVYSAPRGLHQDPGSDVESLGSARSGRSQHFQKWEEQDGFVRPRPELSKGVNV